MKKMMIIAVLISGMLMPAQVFARENKGNQKPRVENRKVEKEDKKNKKVILPADRKDKKGYQMGNKNNGKGKPIANKGKGYNKGYKKEYKDNFKKKPGKPMKPNVIVVNKPSPVPPPPPVKVVYKNNPVSAAASLMGLAALVAIIAD